MRKLFTLTLLALLLTSCANTTDQTSESTPTENSTSQKINTLSKYIH